jgi:hypothetical protein
MDADNNDGISGNLGFAEGSWSFDNAKNWEFIGYNCTYDRCFYSPDNDLDVQFQLDSVSNNISEFTILADVWAWDTGSTEDTIIWIENNTFGSRWASLRYSSSNRVVCGIRNQAVLDINIGTFQRTKNALVGCRYNGSHLSSIYDAVLSDSPAALSGYSNVVKDIYVGNDIFSNDHFMGSIDRVFIFNRSLSATEILAFNNTVLWNSYSDYQTFSSGSDRNNYSVEQDFDFAQVKFKLYANSTDTNIIYPNWNVSFWNFTGVAAAPPGDSCSPDSPLTANHVYQCDDSCTVNSGIDAAGYEIWYNGSGTPSRTIVNASIYNYSREVVMGTNCTVTYL